MAATAGPRKTISVYDYPEHLNPFRDEDNHNKIRFWTIGRKLNRSNSINFSGIKDLRNSWSLKSFMRKGKKGENSTKENDPKRSPTLANGDNSPIVFRRAIQYASVRKTVGSPELGERYVYGGSITPLPRSRFQERLRSSQQEVNNISNTPRMARSDITGSRLSIESTNPFDDPPIPPVRASRRKKKRAPPPPPVVDETINDTIEELRVTETDEKKAPTINEDEIEDANLNVELKIVEDKDETREQNETNEQNEENTTAKVPDKDLVETTNDKEEVELRIKTNGEQDGNGNEILKNADSDDNLIDKSTFPKINIERYRRNSSVNEDDIKLRRGNLEDFPLSSKRSKSLMNTSDGRYVAFDINLNESKNIDINSNEEPQRVVCKVYETRKKSLDNSISSTEKEFIEIDRATRELEKEISKLNTALQEDDLGEQRLSVSEIRRKFDISDTSPNPIPKPRRSHYGESQLNGNI